VEALASRLFDAAGQPIKSPPEIWSGTVGRVSYEARPYFISGTGAVGVKLSLEAARILELVSAVANAPRPRMASTPRRRATPTKPSGQGRRRRTADPTADGLRQQRDGSDAGDGNPDF
jgi:hypothetical protein